MRAGRLIRRAHAHLSTLAPEAAQVLIDAVTTPASDGVLFAAREREVLSLLTEGPPIARAVHPGSSVNRPSRKSAARPYQVGTIGRFAPPPRRLG